MTPTQLKTLRERLRERGLTHGSSRPLLEQRGLTAAPLSYAQERLWFLDQFTPGLTAYNIPAAIRIRGPLNISALEQSLRAIEARHQILRTTYDDVEGRPEQRVGEGQFSLRVEDVLAGTDLQSRIDEEVRQPFSLERGPLWRGRLFRLTDDEHVLVLTIHHIAADGWSTGILMQEMAKLYEAISKGESAQLPELPLQYTDYASWQRESSTGTHAQRQLDFWRGQLEGELPVLELPLDHPRPAVQTFAGATQIFEIPADVKNKLDELCRKEQVTLFTALLTAWQALLCRYANQDDLTVGVSVAGRTRTQLEPLIGFFLNTLVLRTDFSDNPTFRQGLQRVHQINTGATENQEIPVEFLIQALRPERSTSHNALFQTLFVLQTPLPPLMLAGLDVEILPVHTQGAKFDLTLDVSVQQSTLRCSIEYNTDLFHPETAAQLSRHYVALIESAAADPDRRIRALPLLTAEESSVLCDWGRSASAENPLEETLHGWFEHTALTHCERVAVTCGDRRIKYAELDRQANQLAGLLQELVQ
jgi:NRPS condensation-like uncharacterized protein